MNRKYDERALIRKTKLLLFSIVNFKTAKMKGGIFSAENRRIKAKSRKKWPLFSEKR